MRHKPSCQAAKLPSCGEDGSGPRWKNECGTSQAAKLLLTCSMKTALWWAPAVLPAAPHRTWRPPGWRKGWRPALHPPHPPPLGAECQPPCSPLWRRPPPSVLPDLSWKQTYIFNWNFQHRYPIMPQGIFNSVTCT
jgi:hypothetical protein